MDDAVIHRVSQDADSNFGLIPFLLSLFTLLSSNF